ncbi:MAG TPA: lipopolysaccharide assembly protein LapA domain-containing protein [Hydrogenophaga sp.]|uniref:lipopolysaccharide assembly protein LapA domain-containing protein n=1 Tax=Hydrogenophaga sp. TaxID=1904254 RepID=UPI002B98B555|nr:lipopolysaccharide assembly protein LapA domain-containing protein [Hydrogenophaga sp.]HMN92583.1 lipopolysaccharide assembly protein LapA domain-containing protein [Hydrogenophaga sp.]HMP10403.1 lipopolysaccharide assembly protein LapA domain-containing protein [Hydrogenophaga sp.]
MRIRTLILIVAVLLVAGFVALNLDEVFRPTPLNFVFAQVQAPLGLVLLGMLGLLLVLFLFLMVFNQTAHLMEVRRISREATEQRELAEKAETSRYTELRDYLRAELGQIEERQQARTDTLKLQIEHSQGQLARLFEQTGNSLSASLGEMEDRLERQERLPRGPSD